MKKNEVSPFGMQPWGPIVLIALMLVFAFLGSKSAWYEPLSVDKQVEFWVNCGVSLGTLLLAIFTAQSVRETKEVLRAEDRRHQQGFAPFITLGDPFNNNERYQAGFTVYNIGRGVALELEIEVEGYATAEVFDIPPGWIPSDMVNAAAEYEKFKVVKVLPIRNVYFASSLWDGGNNFFVQQEFAANYPVIKQVRYTNAQASYKDMFGNVYRTLYVDAELRQYNWEQPICLRPSKADSSV